MESTSDSKIGIQLRNGIIAVATVAIATLVFFASRAQGPSIGQLAAESVPLEQALTNGKPTFVEFYADWCSSCQAMAPSIAKLKARYGSQTNFVMLNVDNPRWLLELTQYKVDGIPHYAFLNPKGKSLGQVIGLQPEAILEENLVALVKGDLLPKTQVEAGQTSKVKTPPKQQTQPKDHS
jgi:thiol:disulfide interchange protein